MLQHFGSYEVFNSKSNLYSLADIFSDTRIVDHIIVTRKSVSCDYDQMEHVYNIVVDNCKILDSCGNWAILQYLEAYCIKTK